MVLSPAFVCTEEDVTMSRLQSHRALGAIAVVAALNSLSCSSGTNGASDELNNETTPQASPGEDSAANATPIVRAYTDIAGLCQRTEDCGTRGVAASQDVEIIISDAYSEPSGGLCRPQPFEESPCSSESDGSCTPQGCLDSPRAIVTSTSEWQTFEIPFDDFLRPGDGRYEPGVAPPPSLDVTRAYQLQFRAPAGTPEFDLWIDNVAFVSVGP